LNKILISFIKNWFVVHRMNFLQDLRLNYFQQLFTKIKKNMKLKHYLVGVLILILWQTCKSVYIHLLLLIKYRNLFSKFNLSRCQLHLRIGIWDAFKLLLTIATIVLSIKIQVFMRKLILQKKLIDLLHI
jgi:hypothetical protein